MSWLLWVNKVWVTDLTHTVLDTENFDNLFVDDQYVDKHREKKDICVCTYINE